MVKYIVKFSNNYLECRYPGFANYSNAIQDLIRNDEARSINKQLQRCTACFLFSDGITITPVIHEPSPFKLIRSAGAVVRYK
jgi:hypothetical protein